MILTRTGFSSRTVQKILPKWPTFRLRALILLHIIKHYQLLGILKIIIPVGIRYLYVYIQELKPQLLVFENSPPSARQKKNCMTLLLLCRFFFERVIYH